MDTAMLRALALRYVGRYSTTRAKLTDYLQRKLAERGWAEDDEAPVAAIAEHCAVAGYIDEEAFARQRASALSRRGYGNARVLGVLHRAGVGRDTIAALIPSEDEAYRVAENFARRKRIGRFGSSTADAGERRRQFAAMVRAGHSFGLVRHFVEDVPDEDGSELHDF